MVESSYWQHTMGKSAKSPCGMPSSLQQDTKHNTLLNSNTVNNFVLQEPHIQTEKVSAALKCCHYHTLHSEQ